MNINDLCEAMLCDYAFILDNTTGFDKENKEFADFYKRFKEIVKDGFNTIPSKCSWCEDEEV